MTTLTRLHADIDARVQAIRADRADWPCAKGCDDCCRRLAELPQLRAAEWTLLKSALASLPEQRLARIGDDLAAPAKQMDRPLTCPLLDAQSGACPVYAARPLACRSYGFYVQRDRGLYCARIESQVAAGALGDVVWGNHDAIDRQLADLGVSRSLAEWFALWQRDGGEA